MFLHIKFLWYVLVMQMSLTRYIYSIYVIQMSLSEKYIGVIYVSLLSIISVIIIFYLCYPNVVINLYVKDVCVIYVSFYVTNAYIYVLHLSEAIKQMVPWVYYLLLQRYSSQIIKSLPSRWDYSYRMTWCTFDPNVRKPYLTAVDCCTPIFDFSLPKHSLCFVHTSFLI